MMNYNENENDLSGMKRGAERDMGSPQKRARNLGYELRILIPSRVAGSIIGKGGSNITRLRSENKATISVPDCPGPERLITISSDDQDITFGVLSQIVPLIEDASKDRNRSGGDGGEVVEVRLLYHHTQVGCIIGKAGAKIKELRETTSTQIKVYGTCCPRSTDRVVAITGHVEMVLSAIKQIALLVLENPLKGVCDPYDPHNYDDLYAAQYGGYGEGESRGSYGNDRGYGGGRGGAVGGARMGGGPPRGGMRGGYREERGGGRVGAGGGTYHGTTDPNYPVGSNGGRQEDYDAEYSEEDRTTTQVTIPKEYAGAIIGKGGSRIRRIRAESGANITIDEALPGAADRIITITGGSGQIRMAQYLLQQSVKDHGDRKF